MKKLAFIFVALSTFALGEAQDQDLAHITAVSRNYHAYRLQETEPSYGLAKVKAWIQAAERVKHSDETENLVALPPQEYNRLNFKEKFTYTMIHGENESQNCDGMPAFVGEEQKIFAFPLNSFGDEQSWSERQTSFLHHHRSRVIGLLRDTIRTNHRVGVNLKKAILELDAYELIPDMLAVYKKDRKDQDILSVCMVLMKDGHFKPFLISATYHKLYANADASYKSFITCNKANQDLEVQRATAYYKSRTSQS